MRVGIRPPGIPPRTPGELGWGDLSVETQALILGFDQVASHDQEAHELALAGARMPFGG